MEKRQKARFERRKSQGGKKKENGKLELRRRVGGSVEKKRKSFKMRDIRK